MRTACAALALVVAGRPSLAEIASTADKSRPDYISLHAMRGLQTSSDSSEDEVGIIGVLWLLTTDALEACTAKCEDGLAKAFDTTEDVGCVCPNASDSARRLVDEPFLGDFILADKKKHVTANKRWLRGLSELDEGLAAAFALRIKGNLSDVTDNLEHFSTMGLEKVASEFDVQESELEFSTLTVTPHYAQDEGLLTAIADNSDASDVSVVTVGDAADYVGGTKGLGLFLSLVVLLAGTICLTCSCFYLTNKRLQHASGDSQKKHPSSYKASERTTEPVQRSSDTGPGKEASLVVDEKSTFSKDISQSGPASAAVRASVPYAEGDAAAGGSSRYSSISSPQPSRKVNDNVGDDARLNKNAVAPLNRSQGTRDFSAQDEATPKSVSTPSRLRGIGNFLGNATPSHLRRLAGRMAARSPSLSIASSRRSKHSSSGSSNRSRSRSRKSRGSHRRQGTFPGTYSQRNSSEMDHQRPPADPVYTFMIKTIAAKGFKFMSTTEIAFCAMRMYSHFKRTEGNYKRLAVMKNAENVPPVYEIIWQSDGNYEQLGQRQTRFFSSGKGTDAEQEKSLLACLLALSWTNSVSSRSTLQHALSPAQTRVPTPEDIFWDDFKDSTDALSGDDQMVVLARVILLMAESANKPPASGIAHDRDGKARGSLRSSASEANENGVEYADIMKALSALHLREIGILLKTSRPGWQEAHVQLVSVLLVIAFLEEGAKNAPPGGERPDPLSSLEWVGILTPEALDGFLVEKLEARRALVELDLEPSGLVIKHDDDGEVERVEPALGEKKDGGGGGGGSWIGSRGHQRILPRSSERKSRSKRSRRREQSSESIESKKSHSPVVITTINRNKHAAPSATSDGKDSELGAGDRGSVGGASSVHSWVSTPEGGAGGGQSGGIRTIKQQRASSYRGVPAVPSTPTSGNPALPNPAFSGERGAGGGSTGAGGGGRSFGGIGVSESTQNEARHGISPLLHSEVDQRSETSSVVTRVYAPSSCAEDHVAFSRSGPAWTVEESSRGQRSPIESSVSMASPHGVGMSQASVAGSRMGSPPPGVLMDMQRLSERSGETSISQGTAAASRLDSGRGIRSEVGVVPRYGSNGTDSRNLVDPLEETDRQSQQFIDADLEMQQNSPSNFSAVAESDIAFSEAASRFEAPGYHTTLHRRGDSGISPLRSERLGIDPSSPTSAAGSRFEGSPSSNATSLSRIAGGGSPTAAPGRRDMDPTTARSVASSMRSTDSSFFQPSSSRSHKSGTRVSSAASGSSWDEEDLQNIGARWLSERAYNQQFEEHNHP